MGQLSAFDQEVVDILRHRGIFENVDAMRFHLDNGVIIFRCPDGDQMLDRIRNDEQVARAAGGELRPHLLTCHGGSMVLAPDSPLYPGMGADQLYLTMIREAEALKDIKTISAEIHAPCGKAMSLGLTLVEQIVLLMAAKPRIKAIDPTNKVVCRVHINDRSGRKRTYFISRAKWIAFWESEGRQLWGYRFPVDPYAPQPPGQALAGADHHKTSDLVGM